MRFCIEAGGQPRAGKPIGWPRKDMAARAVAEANRRAVVAGLRRDVKAGRYEVEPGLEAVLQGFVGRLMDVRA